MSKITLPERGQPLDVKYLYELAQAINDVSAKVSTATNNYTTIESSGGTTENIKTSETRIVGKILSVANNVSVASAKSLPFTYNFPGDFKYAPVVTASLINLTKGGAGENASLILTDITRSSVTGQITFAKTGTATVNVSIIAIGIPNV
jgi:hypothetical protein